MKKQLFRKKRAKIPEVGIFYIINGKLYVEGIPYTKGEKYGYFVNSPNEHWKFFQSLQEILPELRYSDEYDFPRGRVVYNTHNKKFYMFIDKCVKKEKWISKIKEEMGLPYEKTSVDVDLHYKCHRCDPFKKQIDI